MVYISEKDCYTILEERLRNKRFDVVSFELEPFSEIMGFHGDHAMLKIKAKVDGKEKEYAFFVKTATKSKKVFDEYFAPMKFYFKEHVMLTKVMNDLQAQISKKLTAKCYLSKINKFIVLENLGEAGYEVIRGKRMDLTHAKIAIETFADFHACSFLLEEKGTKIDDKYSEIIYETFFRSFPNTEEYLLLSCTKGLRQIGKRMSTVAANIQDQVFTSVFERIQELSKPSKKWRNVICQGDPWGNNVMYKYQGDTPKEGILVDFQTSRFTPPAAEVMEFLFIATNTSFRKEHSETLKDTYYKRLAHTMEAQGCDVNKYLTRKEFEESCNHYREFGLDALLYYTYVTRVPGPCLAPAAKDEQVFLDFILGGDPTISWSAVQQVDYYRQEMKDAIEEAIEFYTTPARK